MTTWRSAFALRGAWIWLALSAALAAQTVADRQARRPIVEDYARAMIGSVPASLGLDPFYRKYVDALGIPIVSSEKVPDAALLMARDIVIFMLSKRPDARDAMVRKRWRVGVMAESEMTSDIPEHRDRKKPARDDPRLTTREREQYEEMIGRLTDQEYWNRRARGLGGNPTTCAEENLLGYPGTRYYGEHILVHEFSHAIMGGGLSDADPALVEEIRASYKQAMAKGLYKEHYASTTAGEYWAEGAQWWFWSNYEWFDGATRLQTPDDLKAYDPTLYALLERVFPGHHIPADIYHAKNIQPARPSR